MRRIVLPVLLMLGACTTGGANTIRPVEPSGYFPPALFHQTVRCASWRNGAAPVMDDFEDAWYSSHLRAAGERPLTFTADNSETLRFTWLRSFHAPMIVRIDLASGGTAILTATKLSGAGGYAPGEVVETVSRALSAQESERLLDLRRAALSEPPIDCALMVDGARWIVEASGSGGYRYVNAQSPESGAVYELGLLMLGFTGWDVEPVY